MWTYIYINIYIYIYLYIYINIYIYYRWTGKIIHVTHLQLAGSRCKSARVLFPRPSRVPGRVMGYRVGGPWGSVTPPVKKEIEVDNPAKDERFLANLDWFEEIWVFLDMMRPIWLVTVSQRYYPQQIAIMGWNYPFSDRPIGELTSSGAKKMGRKNPGDSCGCSMGGWHWEMTNRFPWMQIKTGRSKEDMLWYIYIYILYMYCIYIYIHSIDIYIYIHCLGTACFGTFAIGE